MLGIVAAVLPLPGLDWLPASYDLGRFIVARGWRYAADDAPHPMDWEFSP
jgi:hypothetical protein